jgi:lysophospholipase L1-like esterase
MREKAIQWTMIIAAVTGLVWVGGLGWAIQDYFTHRAMVPIEMAATTSLQSSVPVSKSVPGSPAASVPASAPVVKSDSLRVLALGDSLTKGTGDPEGKGYVGYLFDDMKAKSGRDIVLENYGVNGQTASQLAVSLGLDPLKAQVKAADFILISIGGNDLFKGGQTLGDLSSARIKAIEDPYMRQLDTILKQLREENATAKIFLIGLYNPFIDLKDSAATTKIVRDWNYRAAEVVAPYPQTVLVPTFDLFQLKVQDYLARDLFHPNAAGYRLIGDRVASLITW